MFEFLYNFFGLNQRLFVIINKVTNFGILPKILQIVSWLFSITHFGIFYILLCIYYYIKLRQIKDLNERQIKFWFLYQKMTFVGITYTIFGLIYTTLKFSINLPRPFCSLMSQDFTTIADTSIERCLSSFPSAHTGLAFLISYLLWSYLNIAQKFIALMIILLVAISRITLAMHYPADIIYSFIIVILVIMISRIVYNLFINNIIKQIGIIIYSKYV